MFFYNAILKASNNVNLENWLVCPIQKQRLFRFFWQFLELHLSLHYLVWLRCPQFVNHYFVQHCFPGLLFDLKKLRKIRIWNKKKIREICNVQSVQTFFVLISKVRSTLMYLTYLLLCLIFVIPFCNLANHS